MYQLSARDTWGYLERQAVGFSPYRRRNDTNPGAGAARLAISAPPTVRSAVPTDAPDTRMTSKKSLNIIKNYACTQQLGRWQTRDLTMGHGRTEIGTFPAICSSRELRSPSCDLLRRIPGSPSMDIPRKAGRSAQEDRSKRAIGSVIKRYGNGGLDCWQENCWLAG